MKRQRVSDLFEKEGWLRVFADQSILNTSLIPHLSPMALLSLVRAHPGIRDALAGKLYLIIYEKILAYLAANIEPAVLDRFLHHNYILTGSALLAALTYASWKIEINDIDLCHTGEDSAPDVFPIVQKRYDPEQDDVPYRSAIIVSYPHSPTLLGVTTYKRLQCGSSHIQLLRVTDVPEYIQTFDYGFCKNQLSATKLVIYNPPSILSSSTLLSIRYYLNQPMQSPAYMMHHFLPTRYSRLCKYIERGFTIVISNTSIGLTDIHTYMTRRMQTNEPELTALASYWHMFWADRIDRQGHVILNRPATWLAGKPPTKAHQNT